MLKEVETKNVLETETPQLEELPNQEDWKLKP